MAVKRICKLFMIIHVVVKLIECSHFRGATFSWIPIDGNSISIHFRISWRSTYSSAYFCNDASISRGNLIGDSSLSCFSGCSGTVGSLQFKCTDYDLAEDWTTGRNTINFTSSSSQFSFGFASGDWINLVVGGGSWSLIARVNLAVRSDTGRINSSPTVDVPPLLKWQYGCKYNLTLPVSDVDGDTVKCRWASGYTECQGICNSFPGAVINETACTIAYTANDRIGYYGVAIQIEDFASATSSTPLSSIPLQFLIQVYSGSGCTAAPEFISPTPNENQYYSIFVRDLFSVTIKARSAIQLNSIITTSAIGMVRSPELKSSGSSWKYIELNVTWSPTVNDAEQDHNLCFFATDINGASSSTRCIRIQVSDIDDCQSNPCQNGGTCADKISRYLCYCIPGYTGYNCEDDINECFSNPCLNGATCRDHVNGYTCACVQGYTGTTCATDIDECLSIPCQNEATCIDRVNRYTCSCPAGYTDTVCATDINECSSTPCKNGGTCSDMVNGYACACMPGYEGTNCEINTNECSSSPCQNAGTCTDRVNGYTCACVTGFTGTNCQTNINECGSSPCQNGGNCTDLINAYICACRMGFTGSNCQTDVDECKSSPCQNGGTCINGQNRYVCLCDSRFHGSVCQNVASHYGTQFYIGMINVYNGNEDIRIDIASKKNGNMTISVPYLDLDEISNVRSGVTTIYINQSLIESGSFTEARGIRIITDIDVAIFVTGIDKLSSNIRDTYLALPVSSLERDYVVASYTPADFVARSEYVLMSVSDNTTVTILNNNVTDSTANVNLFDIHQVSDPRDLTGQAVFGSQKIAMISGTSCAYIPTGVRPCNFLIEQMIPMKFWTNYFIVPSMLPKRGFLLRILSPRNITSSHCFTNTSGTLCKDFDTFSNNENLFEFDVVVVVSNIASSVVQYGVGTGFDNIPGNPFMMVVPGTNNYLNEYVFVIPEVFPKGINYLCIIIPTSAERGLLLDGELVNSSYDHQSVPDPFQNFTVLKLIIGTGFHNVTHADKTIYFGALVYGIAENVGYGYPVGYRYGPDLELCSLRPCKNGGYCSKKIHGYTCSCKPGFTGSHCEKDINECSSNPCQNGATCHDEISRFRCACAPGFFGILCNIETNECSSMPCQNGGTCVDIVNGFECECVDGFNGQTCEKEIDECKSSPCLNGATCTDGLNNFTCICASGYVGDICEVDINECSSFPCQNGGHCTDEINRYTCLCEPGFHGKQCQNVSTHYGTEFCLGILAPNDPNVNVRISIASKSEGNMTIEIPFQDRIEVIQFSKGVTTINVNKSLARTGTFIENRGIYLRTDVDVAVFVTSFDLSSLNSINSYLALPLSVLDNQYVLESEKHSVNLSGFMVVAVYDNTTIYLNGNTLDHLTVSLQELDLYQYTGLFESGRVELTGNKKFAVISGYALCEACSVMATQILPRLLWTNYFIIPTLVNMDKNKIIVTSSSRNISYCLINSTRTTCIDYVGYVNNEVKIGSDTIVLISNTNISVILYGTMNQNTYSNVLSVIPGVSNYLNEYYFIVTADSTSSNFLYIIVPTEQEDGLLLDDNYINSTFERIHAPDNMTKYSVINMAIDGGYHHLTHENAAIKFGALIYTFGESTQHLYSAGFGWESVTQLCSFNPCQNYGVCSPTAAGYTCSCLSGYTGGHCQTDINECSSFPCQNGGKCSDGINTFTCTCTEGFYGRLCETEINACFSFPCQHDGSCVADNKDFRCYCPSGFRGVLCEEEINECYSSPCLNGGTCFDMVNGYTCTCDAGYIGSVCETDINECSSNPCQNGGACADSINGYACLCRQGFTGSNCQTDVNECSSNPCQNEGECIDVINGFSCNCTNGYFGPECEFEVDECLSSPCENGGICEDNINGYTCLCHKWFQGRNCQKVSSNLGREFAVIISYSIIPNMDFLRFDIASKSEGKAIIAVVNSSFRNEVHLYKGVTTINLNDSVFVSDIETLKRAISISADTDVAVFVSAGGKNFSEIRDGYLALPVTALASYYGFDPFISWNMSAIVIALNDETEINVSRSSGNLSAIHLNSFDIYHSSGDIYDMELSGNKEFAVIFGSLCSNCTFVVEQMIPNAFWTNVFIVPSILLQKEYQLQILHSGNLNTSYCIDNSRRSYCSKLNTVGQSDAFVAIDTVVVTSEKAISVLQKWKGLMVMIPGISNYLNEFVFAVPYVKQNSTCYLCVIVPASSERGIMIDENPIESAYHKQRISNSLLDYTVFHLIINEGYHYLTHENQSVKFGAILYCIDDNNGYGFPAGFGYGPDLYTCSVKVCIPEEECVNTTSDLVCSCSAGFTGSNCQTDVNECNSNPCQNGGSCTDQITGFKCHCANGYRGVMCEQDIDECEYNPCKNGATCHNLIDSYNCLCTDGFDGKMCEIDVNECSSMPCQNTGICSDIVNGYTCTCIAGYYGVNCENEIDECRSSPCQHGGNCTDSVNGFICACTPGFTGRTCMIDIDECNSNPCSHGSSCVDLENGFVCSCLSGFDGLLCKNDINECASSPCRNGGTCIDSINDYTCICEPGYNGSDCEQEINECAPGPCINEGSCSDGVNNYTCSCLNGFFGRNCEHGTSLSTSAPHSMTPAIVGSVVCGILAVIIAVAVVITVKRKCPLSRFQQKIDMLGQIVKENPVYFDNQYHLEDDRLNTHQYNVEDKTSESAT